ncbi:MAG TPA: hypothetical protein VIM34_06175 [Burkholderiaceae bacterium]
MSRTLISTRSAQRTVPELECTDEPVLLHDSSTNALIRRYRRLKDSA